MLIKSKKKNPASERLFLSSEQNSHAAEQFRTLRTNINFSSPDRDIKSIVITSAASSEGKSTTAANLAVAFAQEGKKVLLIDGDMRRPTIHYTFRLKNTIGLSTLLTRQSTVKRTVRRSHINNLDLICCGPIPPNPAELLSSHSMDKLLEELVLLYDLIIFDAPPILTVTDSQILANKCEGSILVLKAGATEKRQAVKAKEAIILAQSRLIGVVLNNYASLKAENYYRY